MTMTTGVLRASSACVLLFCLSLGIVGTGDQILCQGEDGHRQVEYANNGCCTAPPTPQESLLRFSATVVQTNAMQDHCGSCVDIPLLTGAMKFLPATRTVNPGPLYPAYSMFCSYVNPGLDYSSNGAPQAVALIPPQSTLRSLRTVVLLV